MDWIQLLGTIVGTGAVVSFLTWIITVKATKKKANNEADNVAIEGMRVSIETMQMTIDKQNERELQKDAKIDELRQREDDYICELARVKTCACVHMGCVLRKPETGGWDNYIEIHRSDEDSGYDFKPINILLREHGQVTKKREDENRN